MKRKHLGSKFEDFLAEDDILEECRASAIKFKITRELEKVMHEQKISKAQIASGSGPAGPAWTVCLIPKTRRTRSTR